VIDPAFSVVPKYQSNVAGSLQGFLVLRFTQQR
jgi:hypothetical protein